MKLEEVMKFIKKSVESLLDQSATCCRLKLDDRLAIFVGWSEGYGDELRDDCIQDKDDPTWAINAGIKVWTSDDMWTDFDYINFPYYEDGEVVDMSITVNKDDEADNYKTISQDLLNWYDDVKNLEIDKKGKITEVVEPQGLTDGEEETTPEKESVEEPVEEKVEEPIKEGLNSNPYKDIIVEYFDYSGDFEFLEMISDIIDRIEDFSDYDTIYEAIDSSMIYTSDQWRMLEHYCTPQDANFDNAWEDLTNDICAICSEIVKSQGGEEDE